MARLKINILCAGLTYETCLSYLVYDPSLYSEVEIYCNLEGEYDICIFVDNVPSNIGNITAETFVFFGSETIYPSDYFDSPHIVNFLNQFDLHFGPYSYSHRFKACLPVLPFMINDNHGKTSALPQNLHEAFPVENRKIGCYCVISNKIITETQYNRVKLVEYLSQKLGSSFELYGNGFEKISNKVDVGEKISHCFAMENRINPFIISEKYFDAVLLKNNLFYIGGDLNRIGSNKYVSTLNNFSFDEIYRKISDGLENYKISDNEHREKSAVSKTVLSNNFIIYMVKTVRKLKRKEPSQKSLKNIEYFKYKYFMKHPYMATRWKFRKRFL